MRYMCILVNLQSPEISDWGPKFTFIPLADWVDVDLTTVAADLRIITNYDMILQDLYYLTFIKFMIAEKIMGKNISAIKLK